jgi:hypothetical protein
MRIDLRYVLPIVAFYVPGLMLLVGGWMLGLSTEEARAFVIVMGLIMGTFSVGATILAILDHNRPIWWTIWKR